MPPRKLLWSFQTPTGGGGGVYNFVWAGNKTLNLGDLFKPGGPDTSYWDHSMREQCPYTTSLTTRLLNTRRKGTAALYDPLSSDQTSRKGAVVGNYPLELSPSSPRGRGRLDPLGFSRIITSRFCMRNLPLCTRIDLINVINSITCDIILTSGQVAELWRHC